MPEDNKKAQYYKKKYGDTIKMPVCKILVYYMHVKDNGRELRLNHTCQLKLFLPPE